MKSDQVHHRSKVKDLRLSQHGETWPIADLCVTIPDEIENNSDILSEALNILSASPSAMLMMKEAAEQGWRLGLASLEKHDFHLDVPDRVIVLDNNGCEPAALVRSYHFFNTLLVSLTRALRDVWQEKRHGGFDENYTPESVLFLERVRAADCDVMTVLTAWELRNNEDEASDDLWRHIISSEEGDMAQAFSYSIETTDDRMLALGAAFRQWFRNAQRMNTCDHETLEYMDDVLSMNPGASSFGKKRAGRICVEVLSCLPDKTAYLRGTGEEILRDPSFAGLCEPINQSHFLHITRDAQVVYVQNVPFRDARLAAKIFPGGNMTPEREDVTQKS
jgi:hypothetical protein